MQVADFEPPFLKRGVEDLRVLEGIYAPDA